MKKTLRLKIHLLFAGLILIQAGCIKKTRALPQDQVLLPAKSAPRTELTKTLEAKSRQVQTLKGTMSIALSGGGPASGVLTEYHETRGTILVERPDNIHVQVQVPLVLTTVANMVSDGKEFRIYLPLENRYMVGDVNAPVSAKNSVKDLRPQQFLAGLFVDIRPWLADPMVRSTFEEAIEGVRRYYVFSFINVADREANTIEKVWMDRTADFQISRKQMFGKDGRLELDARYSNYEAENGIEFPHAVVLQLPLQDYTIKMTFTKPVLNDKLPENAFDLPRPNGSELVQVTGN